MRIVSLLVVIASLSIVSALEAKKDNPPQGQPKIPAALAESEAVLKRWQANAPTTLAEAHTALERMLSPGTLAEIDAMPSEKDMIQYHFSLGLNIRNGWGLWAGSPLAKHMQELGFVHPDDMSGVILNTFWCKRHGQDFRLKERAAKYKEYWDAALKAQKEEKDRAEKAKAAMRNMMMGLRFEKRDVPTVRMPDRIDKELRARFLSPFRGGVFLTTYCRGRIQDRAVITAGLDVDPTDHTARPKPEYDDGVARGFYFDPADRKLHRMKPGDDFFTRGWYFDPADRQIHRIRVEEVNDVYGAVVAGARAWFTGHTSGKAVLVGVNGQDRMTLPLPQEDELPDLGLDGQSLLAVYSETIFRLADRKWTIVHSGDILLPRSGPPPQLHGNMVFLRDEGTHENRKRLWWLTLGEQSHLSVLDHNMALIEPGQLNWANSFSYCVTRTGDLWACVGEGYNRKSLLRRSRDGSYSIAIMNNSVRFTEEPFGSEEMDQGLSVSAITALPDDTLLLVGDAGLYRLKGTELVQELSFTNTRQEISDSNGKVVLHWHWDPSDVLVLDDRSYFISGAFGGIYLLSKGNDGQWSFLPLDEKLGDPVVW